jgi:hypothetical protein
MRLVRRSLLLLAVPGAVLVAIASAGPLRAQIQGDLSRPLLLVPPPTEEGEWNGTWVYTSRDLRAALWIRGGPGSPEIKLRLLRNADAESFETDWTGHAAYEHRGRAGRVALDVDERDPNAIRGRWSWELGDEAGSRSEIARLEFHRTADGRLLVMNFEGYAVALRSGSRERRIETPNAWTFVKASRRLVRWEELPL